MTEPLEYARPPRRGPVTLGGKIVVGVGMVIIAWLIDAVLIPGLNPYGRPNYNWVACSSNLKQIGQAILLYASENHDAMPADFVTLVETQDLLPEVFVCRAANGVKSAATQPADVRADFINGGHCSYVYVEGLAALSKLTANEVVAFEPAGNHENLCNVLFGDGHVDRVDEITAKAIERQFARGIRPIRIPVR